MLMAFSTPLRINILNRTIIRRLPRRRLPSFNDDDDILIVPAIPDSTDTYIPVNIDLSESDGEELPIILVYNSPNNDIPNENIINTEIPVIRKDTTEDNKEEDLECCICYEKARLTTNCGHAMCLSCPGKLTKPSSCPYCRAIITEYRALDTDVAMSAIYSNNS